MKFQMKDFNMFINDLMLCLKAHMFLDAKVHLDETNKMSVSGTKFGFKIESNSEKAIMVNIEDGTNKSVEVFHGVDEDGNKTYDDPEFLISKLIVGMADKYPEYTEVLKRRFSLYDERFSLKMYLTDGWNIYQYL